MLLRCTRRCGGNLFRVLLAEVDVDGEGEYQSHRIVEPGYVCLNCGSPAIDLAQVPEQIAADREEDVVPQVVDVLCPVCGAYLEAV